MFVPILLLPAIHKGRCQMVSGHPNFSSKMVPNLFEARVNGWCVAYHDTKNGAQWVAE